MNAAARLSALLLLAALFSACGQKGPLYLPDEKEKPKPANASSPGQRR